MGALTNDQMMGNPRGEWANSESATVYIPLDEWRALYAKVNLLCDVLATVLDAISASPFAAAIPPDVAAKVAEIARM